MRHDRHVRSATLQVYNEIFEATCKSGVTRLKSSCKLSSLLANEEEVDSRRRHRFEGIMEEMASVRGG